MTDTPHPLAKWLGDNGVKQNEFASRVKCSESHLALVLDGKRGISLELALAIEHETGGDVPPRVMFDHVRKREAPEVAAE